MLQANFFQVFNIVVSNDLSGQEEGQFGAAAAEKSFSVGGRSELWDTRTVGFAQYTLKYNEVHCICNFNLGKNTL